MTTPDKKLEEIREATRRANEALKDIKMTLREVDEVHAKIQRTEQNIVKLGDTLLAQIRFLVDAKISGVAEEARLAALEAMKEVIAKVVASKERSRSRN